ncbi:unnamed protein product [Didymodactylos carnosus]|uniref:Uncharacterized protein n=1 Tax=Didymodactylos carnosus TaxID=1234261 RepID=A0A815EFQ3_9BILA|nr:unnamed protein product [Didymodactylos carnosus]CAF4150057.1 unnamed protein product [Didymodactylos carnosus]
MEDKFEQLVAALTVSSPSTNVLHQIILLLEQQTSESLTPFVSQSFQSLLTLEQWTWQVLSKDSHQCIGEPNYSEFFHTLASFNKTLILQYDGIEADTKASLLIPDGIHPIDDIFGLIEKSDDENDSFLIIVSLWFENLVYFLHEYPQFEISPLIAHINQYMASRILMTDQYKFYLSQLRQAQLPQSIFTAKQQFYINTCSFSLGSYLLRKPETFTYTPNEMLHHICDGFSEIIFVHSENVESWSKEFVTCIARLLVLVSGCCLWAREKRLHVDILFPTEQIICKYIDALIHIIGQKQFLGLITAQRSNDETILVDISLLFLMHIAQSQNLNSFFRSKTSLPDILLTIAETSA